MVMEPRKSVLPNPQKAIRLSRKGRGLCSSVMRTGLFVISMSSSAMHVARMSFRRRSFEFPDIVASLFSSSRQGETWSSLDKLWWKGRLGPGAAQNRGRHHDAIASGGFGLVHGAIG